MHGLAKDFALLVPLTVCPHSRLNVYVLMLIVSLIVKHSALLFDLACYGVIILTLAFWTLNKRYRGMWLRVSDAHPPIPAIDTLTVELIACHRLPPFVVESIAYATKSRSLRH